MELLWNVIEFILFSGIIVLISKNILVKTLRNLAENLRLNPKTVGDIAGIATSIPELLTICVSSFKGLISASIYNVLSSNIINFIQYITAIFLNKNQNKIKNKAIQIDIMLVIVTIILPISFILTKSEIHLIMIPVLFVMFWGVKEINNIAHKLYLQNKNKEVERVFLQDDGIKRDNIRVIIKNICILIITGVVLFFIGNLLGNTLEILCRKFSIPEFVIGVILGFVTSIPELVTFFESQRHHKKLENNMLGVVEATNNLLMSNSLNLFIIYSVGQLGSVLF